MKAKNKNKETLRVAEVKDFKIGTRLVTSEGYEFVLSEKYADGIWEARGDGGGKVIFENEARFYKIKEIKENN